MLAVLTGALVLLTAYYAWQTRSMVLEMRNARQLSLRPKIALDVELLGPKFGVIVVANVGAGAALDSRLTLVFHNADGENEEREWIDHLIAPGERHEFLPPKDVNNMDQLVATYPRVSARGTVVDLFGDTIDVNETIAIAEAWERIGTLSHRWQEPAPDRLIRGVEDIQKAIERAAGDFRELARSLRDRDASI